MSRIVIVGLDDLLTFSISKMLTEESESSVIAITPTLDSADYQCDKSYTIDLENNLELDNLMKQNNPDIIINTYVYSDNTEKIASNREMYLKYLDSIITLSEKFDAKLIHFSNAKVFSGIKGDYSENDIRDAKDEYGLTLIEAENEIINRIKNYTIIRYSEIIGANDNYFDVSTELKNNIEDNLKTIATNDIYNPIFINDLCAFLFFIVDKNKTGIYHAGAIDKTSIYNLYLKIGELLEFDLSLIESNSDSNLNYSLNTFKAHSEMIYKFSTIDSYLISMKHFINMSNKYYYQNNEKNI